MTLQLKIKISNRCPFSIQLIFHFNQKGMKFNKIIIAMLMVCVAQFTQAQTIHAILCGATNVSDIGTGCQSSLKLMENALTYVGSQIDMDVDFTLLSGNDFRKDNIMETIADLKVGDDDVIFFYSTSHGFNYNNNPSKFTFIGAHPNKIEMTRSELENFGLSRNGSLSTIAK